MPDPSNIFLKANIISLEARLGDARRAAEAVLRAWDADYARGLTLGVSIGLHVAVAGLRQWLEEL
jgi:hypothetical protein